MPQATDLIVKDAVGTDRTFTLLSPASGRGGIAEWALKIGATAVVWPTITLASSRTSKQASRDTTKVRVPATYNDVVTGLPVVSSAIESNLSVTVPDNFPDDQKDDAIAYTLNAFQTALLKACYRDGLPAT